MKLNKKLVKVKGFRPRVRSRHPSHSVLRKELPRMPFRSIIRLGSTTPTPLDVKVECNSIQAVKNSSSKLLMKKCFNKGGVRTAAWWTTDGKGTFYLGDSNTKTDIFELPFPLIVKHIYGSRGTGNSKLNTVADLTKFVHGKDMKNYIIEEYLPFLREYRLHVTKSGCFYTCRKMLKRDTPEEKKFQRHDDNCVWIIESNPSFDKPVNWDAVVADCVKALKSIGLDIGAFDLKIQSAKDADGNPVKNPDWIVIESCSAPSFGAITAQKYKEEIPKILLQKHKEI